MTPTWIPVIEKQPDERVTVIVGQDNLQGGTTNFAGSGTTLAVATSMGRLATGIELNPDYAAIARRRVEAA